MQINYAKLKNTDWYRQGADSKPIYIYYPVIACSAFTIKDKPAPLYYTNIIVDWTNEHMVDALDKDNLHQIASYYFGRQKRNSAFITDIKKHWEKNNVKLFREEVDLIERADFSKLPNKEMADWFMRFSAIYMSVWRNSIFHDAFDVWGEKILNDTLRQAKLNLSADELRLLLSNPSPSILQQERLEVLKVAESAREDKNLLVKDSAPTIVKVKKDHPKIFAKLDQLSRKYHWLYNDFHTPKKLGKAYFWQEVKKLLKSYEELQAERQFKKEFSNRQKNRSLLVQKYNLNSRTMSIINMLVTIARWRDERKAYMQMAGSTIKKFVREFSRRTSLPDNMIEHFLWPEVKNIFQLKTSNIKKIKARQTSALGIILRRDHIYWTNKKEARKIREILSSRDSTKTELQGSPAWPGQVTARAKIIKGQKDFHKLKRGEILVAPNTRPEYVPIMKIAGAIISEEGGITCHAAIMSRELKKPAVVGVQGAIALLKDGDQVEVDAEQGVVRKIK